MMLDYIGVKFDAINTMWTLITIHGFEKYHDLIYKHGHNFHSF